MAEYEISGLPNYTKMSATSLAVISGLVLFHPNTLFRFRLKWVDSWMILYCVSPFATSVLNGLGSYDGFSSITNRFITWGMPYFIGRTVFFDRKDIAVLAESIVICALIYVPLCLWEVRMSPQLHRQIYGFAQHDFGQTLRGGGYRPQVFMSHGLQLAMWLSCATVISYVGWASGYMTRIGKIPAGPVVVVLAVCLMFVKSLGAAILGLAMIALYHAVQYLGRPVLWTLVPVILVSFMVGRISGAYSGDRLVRVAEGIAGSDRANSLNFRLLNESLLIDKALEKPFFGWGGYGRNRVYDDNGEDLTITDGLWIISFGSYGLIGLVSLYCVFLISPIRFLVTSRDKTGSTAPMIGLSMSVLMFAIDSIPNAMMIPVFVVTAGALVSSSSRPMEDCDQELRILYLGSKASG